MHAEPDFIALVLFRLHLRKTTRRRELTSSDTGKKWVPLDSQTCQLHTYKVDRSAFKSEKINRTRSPKWTQIGRAQI